MATGSLISEEQKRELRVPTQYLRGASHTASCPIERLISPQTSFASQRCQGTNPAVPTGVSPSAGGGDCFYLESFGVACLELLQDFLVNRSCRASGTMKAWSVVSKGRWHCHRPATLLQDEGVRPCLQRTWRHPDSKGSPRSGDRVSCVSPLLPGAVGVSLQ